VKRPRLTRQGYALVITTVVIVALALITQSRPAYLLLALLLAAFLAYRAKPRRHPSRPDWRRDRARREEEAEQARKESERRLGHF
jgi:uncharacterized protein (DUF58 family)